MCTVRAAAQSPLGIAAVYTERNRRRLITKAFKTNVRRKAVVAMQLSYMLYAAVSARLRESRLTELRSVDKTTGLCIIS